MSSYETSPSYGISLDTRDSSVEVPVFGNVRCNFLKGKFTPFVDLKAGAFVTNNSGLYLNASVGCRMAINQKQGVSLSVGYSRENLEFETFDEFIGNTLNYTRVTTKRETETITMKVGFEF